MTKKGILLVVLVNLTACALFVERQPWPDGAAPRGYFEAAYMEDEMAQMYQTEDQYLTWVIRFYTGNNLSPGWLNMTRRVLDELKEPERDEVRKRLFRLGGRIGGEWAKANGIRLLNTRNAAVWRDALIESLRQDDLDNYLDKLEDDVEDLLSGNLDQEDIYFERYYVDEFDF